MFTKSSRRRRTGAAHGYTLLEAIRFAGPLLAALTALTGCSATPDAADGPTASVESKFQCNWWDPSSACYDPGPGDPGGCSAENHDCGGDPGGGGGGGTGGGGGGGGGGDGDPGLCSGYNTTFSNESAGLSYESEADAYTKAKDHAKAVAVAECNASSGSTCKARPQDPATITAHNCEFHTSKVGGRDSWVCSVSVTVDCNYVVEL